MPTLEVAIRLAVEAHKDQREKNGSPYILHPLRVLLRVQGEAERIAAVLHDVVEDTQVTLDDLRQQGFSQEVVAAVDALTKRDGEPYEAAIERAAGNPIARVVKMADLEDNLDVRRLPMIQERDLQRLQRYLTALTRLKAINGPAAA